jgi:hypothetical protein
MITHYHDGISADPANAPVIKQERESVLQEYFSFFIEEYKEIDALKSKLNLLRQSRKIKWLIKIGLINDF